MENLRIDPEFQSVLPSKEEDYNKLEKTVLEDGRFTDPFITWNGFIIDGHTRYRIMKNHPEIDLQPYEKKMDDVLPDRYAVIVWIATHQESRRNLNDFEWAEIHKKAYDAQKKTIGGNYGNQYTKMAKFESDQSQNGEEPRSHAGETATALAKEFGISTPSKFKHSVRLANAMDEGEKFVPGFKNALKGGTLKASKDRIEGILDIKDEKARKGYVEAISNGEKVISPRQARKLKPMSPEMKDFTKKMLDVVAEMENEDKEYGIDDAIHDLDAAADVFFTQVRFVLDEHETLFEDNDGESRLIEFIKSVTTRLEEIKA